MSPGVEESLHDWKTCIDQDQNLGTTKRDGDERRMKPRSKLDCSLCLRKLQEPGIQGTTCSYNVCQCPQVQAGVEDALGVMKKSRVRGRGRRS